MQKKKRLTKYVQFFPSVPTEPRSVKVLSLAGSPTELLVTWDPPAEPNGIILSYTVYCYVLSNDSITNQPLLAPLDTLVTTMPLYIEVPGNQTEAVMEDLVPYTYYLCLATANTSIGESNSSSIQLNRTDESGKLTLYNVNTDIHFMVGGSKKKASINIENCKGSFSFLFFLLWDDPVNEEIPNST